MKNRTEGEGLTALSLALIVAAVWLFPIPIVIYAVYVGFIIDAGSRVYRWLRGLITTWGRLAVCGALSFGLLGGFILFGPRLSRIGGLLEGELHPLEFSHGTIAVVTGLLLLLFVEGLKDLWRGRGQPKN